MMVVVVFLFRQSKQRNQFNYSDIQCALHLQLKAHTKHYSACNDGAKEYRKYSKHRKVQ